MTPKDEAKEPATPTPEGSADPPSGPLGAWTFGQGPSPCMAVFTRPRSTMSLKMTGADCDGIS